MPVFMCYRIGRTAPWLLAALALLMSGCGTAPGTTTGSSAAPVFDERAYADALQLMNRKEYGKAVTQLEEVVRGDDRRAGPYINLGIAYRQLGKLEEAKQALRIASERESGTGVAFNELGIVYRKLGEFENAREAYRNSIRKHSGYGKAYLNLGILCDIYLEDFSCAISNYEKYLKVSKDNGEKVSLWVADLKKRSGRKK